MFSPCKRFYILQLCHPFPPHHQFFSAQRRTSLVAFCNCVMFLATDHPCRVRRVVQQCRNLSGFHNFYAQSSNITIFTGDFHHEHVLRIVPCKSKCSHNSFIHNFFAQPVISPCTCGNIVVLCFVSIAKIAMNPVLNQS